MTRIEFSGLQRLPVLLISLISSLTSLSQNKLKTELCDVDSGWARNSVNTVIFRKNSLVTYKDTQYIAYYDQDAFVVIGKRVTGAKHWELTKTKHKGNVADAHNCISLMVDGRGYLHLAWDHHGNRLNYVKSLLPGSLKLSDRLTMTGKNEDNVTYPEFYRMKDGGLIFMYRDGSSGKGNLVMNRYDPGTESWTQVQSNLIDGEGQRNAYWQACIDKAGTIHVSWVWRESPDVASNHDMCYARSLDNGQTWEKSTGESYRLPIVSANAEYVARVPQKSELINQTSMCADDNGNPIIASYWKEAGSVVPQYQIMYIRNREWKVQNTGFRKTGFSLSGVGTKKIPIARPQVLSLTSKKTVCGILVFRDEERGNRVSIAINKNLYRKNRWKVIDLSDIRVGSWEPTYDTELWKENRVLALFIQQVLQADSEGLTSSDPQLIKVLAWDPE